MQHGCMGYSTLISLAHVQDHLAYNVKDPVGFAPTLS